MAPERKLAHFYYFQHHSDMRQLSMGLRKVPELLELPPQILRLICSFMPLEDIYTFRLTCQQLNTISAPFMFGEITFQVHCEDFDLLHYLAEHPTYSQHVRSLTYITRTLPLQFMSFDEFVSWKLHDDQVSDQSSNTALDTQSNESLRPPPACIPLDVFLDRYNEYKELIEWQSSTFAGKHDFDLLEYVFQKFTRLEKVTVSVDDEFRSGQITRSPFDGGAFVYDDDDHLAPKGCRQTASVLSALALLPSLECLTTLRLGSIDFSPLRQLEEPELFQQVARVCHNLTTFELVIDCTGWDEAGRIQDDDEMMQNFEECRNVVSGGMIRRLLTSMPHLETAAVGFTLYWEDMRPAAVRDIIAPGFRWPSLRSLELRYVEARQQDIVDVVQLHSGTLRSLRLPDLRLTPSSWLTFLPDLRSVTRGMGQLEHVFISGDVDGDDHDHDLSSEAPRYFWEVYDTQDIQRGGTKCRNVTEAMEDYLILGKALYPVLMTDEGRDEN